MKNLFYLGGGLLGVSGVLHLAKSLITPAAPGSMVALVLTGLFGIAYLVIGYLLLRQREVALRLGTYVPLVGLVLTLVGMSSGTDAFTLTFIVLDILVSACCVILMVSGRAPIHRLR